MRGSKRYANAQLAEFARQADYSKVRAGTDNELLDRWVSAAAPKWASSTRRENLSIIEQHLKPHLGLLPVGKIMTDDVDDLYGYLVHGGGRDGAPLAPGRVMRIHGVLHRAFAQAVRWEWVWFNPVSNASPPRVPPPEVRADGCHLDTTGKVREFSRRVGTATRGDPDQIGGSVAG